MHRLSSAVIFALSAASTVAAANCGPLALIGDNDYCISCPGRTPFKENQCPGGDVGLATESFVHRGCRIAYHSPKTCQTGMPAPGVGRQKLTAQDVANFNPVSTGRAAITMKGDDVVITMKKSDFDKLMTLGSVGSK